MRMNTPLLAAAILLAPACARAARYDPDFDRAALRQAATLSHSTTVDASGLALEPEKATAIAAGLDEGLRQAGLAAGAARSLDAAARRRGTEIESAAKDSALDRRLKELREPAAAELERKRRLASALNELKERVGKLPEEERKKIEPLLDKAEAALRSADAAAAPLEGALDVMAQRGRELRSLRRDSLLPLVEISSAAANVIRSAEELPAAVAQAKALLDALGQEPRAAARTRAWERLDLLRGATRLLFQDADRACNRAYDLRRLSSDFEDASEAFEAARKAAAPVPDAVKAFLNQAEKALREARDRLKKD